MAAVMSTTGTYRHNSGIGTPMIRWCQRQLVLLSGALHLMSAMALHSLHVLYSLHFLHSLPILRWNLLAMQYNLVQLTSFECPSMVPLFIVLQLKSIQSLLVPELSIVKMQLSSSFLPIPFLDLVLAPLTVVVWNHGPVIRESSATSVPVVSDVSAILGKV